MVNNLQLTPEGFKEQFEAINKTLGNQPMKAYELAEEIHEKIFGKRRYSGYQNFLTINNKKKARQKEAIRVK